MVKYLGHFRGSQSVDTEEAPVRSRSLQRHPRRPRSERAEEVWYAGTVGYYLAIRGHCSLMEEHGWNRKARQQQQRQQQ